MADATTKKILDLLAPTREGEVRCAAVRVLAEIGARDKTVDRALCECIDDADEQVRLAALRAAGKLRIEAALPKLLQRVTDGGPESEAAARSAAAFGAKGTKALRELMPKTSPGLRRRIVAALGSADSTSGETAAIDALLDSDPGVVDAATRSLIGKVPSLTAQHRRALVDRILELLKNKKKQEPLSIVSETALMRLLAGLKDPRGEEVCWERIAPEQPTDIRAAALHVLGTLSPPGSAERIRKLLVCAADRDFRVAAPALMILKNAKVNARSAKDWLPLLDAPDPAARRFAIDKLSQVDSAEVAQALVKQLGRHDRSLRQETIAHLADLKYGQEALVASLLEADHADLAWGIARAQMSIAPRLSPSLLEKIRTEACNRLEAGDRRGEALIALLREADARSLRDFLEEKARAYRKQKKYEKALAYLRVLTRDPGCTDDIRFEQAACSLKLSAHDLAVDSRQADPCLRQFAGLLHRHETHPLAYIEKAKWLDPDDLFYLGFHFSEQKSPEREFGADVLRLLLKRSPKSKIGKDAKAKLRREGLA
ncbi:MAG: hypothetical protein KatS3mg105_4486 [Gemmatales bacterium]|nr:MAG: hypothetical protein KatS3mg105_4486 [Gemmatales bacterium]